MNETLPIFVHFLLLKIPVIIVHQSFYDRVCVGTLLALYCTSRDRGLISSVSLPDHHGMTTGKSVLLKRKSHDNEPPSDTVVDTHNSNSICSNTVSSCMELARFYEGQWSF